MAQTSVLSVILLSRVLGFQVCDATTLWQRISKGNKEGSCTEVFWAMQKDVESFPEENWGRA